MNEGYKKKKKELKIRLERDGKEFLSAEYRKIMGANYNSLEELWKDFDNIENEFFKRFGMNTRGDLIHQFEKEKLRLMSLIQ